ncbi:hypothetical protein [Sphingobium sp. HDIP04]|uniref:hypothetical protein n=1 Tax=Sphingobium sp. HDIP04 TaxID=428994 RepID=UPI00038764D6|nr:hypothetical protein [Sphingobium sp. HDIP04]EQB00944.1 hypothetical protein L286_17085 [Sphingobium sp. HDIP04]
MRGWTFLLAGLILWAVHFFALYAIASIFLTTLLARGLTLMVTLACLAVSGLLLARTLRSDASATMEAWMRAVALCGTGLAAIAIIWQALPALLV